MKKYKLILSLVLASLMVLGLFVSHPSNVKAEDSSNNSEYTYTVRIFPGAQGTFNSSGGGTFQTIDGQQVIVYENMKYGEAISFSTGWVDVTNPNKYYASGIRESGRDNKEAPYFTVTRDIDYVVAYTIPGATVQYTVTYYDMNGNQIAPNTVGDANIGDKLLVGALIIPGYEDYTPGYLYENGTFVEGGNIAKTLVDNPLENVIRFTYRAPQVTPQESSSTTPTESSATTPTESSPTTPTESSATETTESSGAEGTGESSAAGTEESSNASGTQESGQPGQESSGAGTEESSGQNAQESGGQESNSSTVIIDLDDSSVPLAGPDDESSDKDKDKEKDKDQKPKTVIEFLKTPGGIIAAVAGVGGLGFVLALIIYGLKKKDRKDNDR